MQKTKSGFTLVELLIVIVVIAILAAITLVAYNGIQDQAKNAALLSGIDTLEKALIMYEEENGSYPVPTDLPPQTGSTNGSGSIACLQPTNGGWPAQDTLSSSQCSTIGGAQPNYIGYSPVVIQALKTELGSIPDTSNYTVSVTNDGVPFAGRGIIYAGSPPDSDDPHGSALLGYIIRGNQTCGRGEKMTVGGTTECTIVLP